MIYDVNTPQGELKLGSDQRRCTQVRQYSPGTSNWNKIEHRQFCHITANWRGRQLVRREVVANLIGFTTTTQGLRIKAALDEYVYAAGIQVSGEELAAMTFDHDAFHGEWNYQLLPHNSFA